MGISHSSGAGDPQLPKQILEGPKLKVGTIMGISNVFKYIHNGSDGHPQESLEGFQLHTQIYLATYHRLPHHHTPE